MEYVAVLEKLKGGAAGAQARVTDNLARSRTAGEAERGVPPAKRCQGLAAELGLARRTSPHRGAQSLGLARALVREMPRTHELLTRGEISEWRATLVVRETAVLSVEDRQQVDAELGDSLARLGDREAAAKARAIGYRLDPGSAIRRTRGARSDRHVSLRPAPDTMCYLTALLPVEQGRPVLPPSGTPPTPHAPTARPAHAARSWPTRSSSASPDGPAPATSTSRCSW